jgi:hypothetical protein
MNPQKQLNLMFRSGDDTVLRFLIKFDKKGTVPAGSYYKVTILLGVFLGCL